MDSWFASTNSLNNWIHIAVPTAATAGFLAFYLIYTLVLPNHHPSLRRPKPLGHFERLSPSDVGIDSGREHFRICSRCGSHEIKYLPRLSARRTDVPGPLARCSACKHEFPLVAPDTMARLASAISNAQIVSDPVSQKS
jgi:hypothetical protein